MRMAHTLASFQNRKLNGIGPRPLVRADLALRAHDVAATPRVDIHILRDPLMTRPSTPLWAPSMFRDRPDDNSRAFIDTKDQRTK